MIPFKIKQEYFFIKFTQLQSRRIFSFQIFIYNPVTKMISLFLPANKPLRQDQLDLLKFIDENRGKIAIARDQSMTFLEYMNLNESDVPELTAPPPPPEMMVSEMFRKKVEMREKSEGAVKLIDEFKLASENNNFTRLIERSWDEFMSWPPHISMTVSLVSQLAEKIPPFDNELNRIVAVSYYMAKNFNLKDENSLAELVLAAFLHHLGLGQIDLRIIRGPQHGLSEKDKKSIKQHPGLTQHLLRKIPLTTKISPKVIEIILDHHERGNGSGYPVGKKEAHLDLRSSILGAVSHLFEYSEGRIHGGARFPLDVLIRKIKNKHFSPGLEMFFSSKVDPSLETLAGSGVEEKDKKAA